MNRRLLISLIVALLLLGCKTQKRVITVKSHPAAEISSPALPPGIAGYQEITGNGIPDVDPTTGDALVREARTWLGTPYLYGGQTKDGTDCSGFLMTVYKKVCSLSLPRNSAEQRDYCLEIPRQTLQAGDLIFFSSSIGNDKVSHVGMYVGEGRIIHASTSRGVIESGLEEKYYQSHYLSSGRVLAITVADSSRMPANVPKKNPDRKPAKVIEMSLDEFVASSDSVTSDSLRQAEIHNRVKNVFGK